ncbi:4-(cytidine 5'-diphospho)-2-C-methyl-D-erythritol kinase [Verminephrobacter eiseniae]|uniref:4-(cytidine 5'-diphospho)-2-C-methyl-D-erythritol kinase n=1 Tax=Verminephrobacter eiseniae TaxID=364317 RepID=UPI0010CFEA77|nr:4-(cytidine 5'-diphospho)-2-C-methyl-D-erythritol kinase [Verminephrobacter eiseniae]KAB7632546.1 4-(cytidine 5'-diphospho)-2-C-methyl-D-erythritol kinase [Verminephrobacter sp. Larva24]MCW5233804.1 4-(cytidine 5'-diphospho)-2-C-methyl-D-erythritol kinase [Verminephrobacter eiseniae]MCW5261929.1 4-(cytidine 5'-diphospho)-2-C-methyl-D-erythritol kinase [Verminephrobacter eiseniae]MCW5294642.1 4-(cytidine 5'-diphospho)-2-C-methyl-D-erythritol kinase [Verminephrobacter eiseniae]MCW8185696.1 4-
MQALYDLPAPAKLNLFLHITGRRADGYHLIESVFMLIDWCDTLHFECRADGAISRQDLGAPLPAADLSIRAAHALRAATGCRQGAHIGLLKRLPAQAGIGGGSSDAATTLLALNRLWGLGLSLSALEKIGVTLGADVPFFVRGRNARVAGIGEIITPLAHGQLPPACFAVVKPAAGLETKAIFSSPLLKRASGSATISGFAAADFGRDGDCYQDADFCRNDLQPVAQALCPEVTQAIEWLRARGLQGRMTGSGSAVFAQIPQAPDLGHVGDLGAAPEGWQVRVCENLMLHPLAGWAADED